MTPPRPTRYESLDAWRGLACLLVVLYHSTNAYAATDGFLDRVREHGGTLADWLLVLVSKMWIGVPMFFVISGYCIAATADAARKQSRPAGPFLYRRLKRIYPPLWAYLALCAAVLPLVPASYWYGPSAGYSEFTFKAEALSASHWLGSLTLTEEWRPLAFGPGKIHFSTQLWTLCYEEQFYVVVAAILFVAPRFLFPAMALVTALVFLNVVDLNALLGRRLGVDFSRYQWAPDGVFFNGLWLSFAAGVAVYYRAGRATPILARCLDLLLAIFLFWSLRSVPGPWEFKSNTTCNLAVAVGFALLLCALRRFDAPLARTRWLAPFRWCGRMCYSLYLVHLPITLFGSSLLYRWGPTDSASVLAVGIPVCLSASLAPAALFHRLVEKRFLNSPSSAKRPAERDAMK